MAKTLMTLIFQHWHLECSGFVFQWLSGPPSSCFSWIPLHEATHGRFTRTFVQNVADPSVALHNRKKGVIFLIAANCIAWKRPCQTRSVAITVRTVQNVTPQMSQKQTGLITVLPTGLSINCNVPRTFILFYMETYMHVKKKLRPGWHSCERTVYAEVKDAVLQKQQVQAPACEHNPSICCAQLRGQFQLSCVFSSTVPHLFVFWLTRQAGVCCVYT